tara:strand:+ start:3948 stop:4973 length:1026 start_codon:yes stop_codon:yes gene_type:complete
MRAFFSVLLLGLTLVVLAGCNENNRQKSDASRTTPGTAAGTAIEPSASLAPAAAALKANSDIRIALVMKTRTNPFFIKMEKGARAAEQELGIALTIRTAAQETSTTQQIGIVDKLVREGEVQAIVIAPADSVRLIPSLKLAQDKGIHVVNIDNRLDPGFLKKSGQRAIPFVSVDNQKSAYLAAKYIASRITAPAEAALLEGIPAAANSDARKRGALQAFAENPNLTVVASETAHWKIDEGYNVTKEIFQAYPNVALLFAANDMMALGAIEYLKESQRRSVAVAAFDAIDDARAAIRDGWLAVTVDQQPWQQGYLGVVLALRAIKGQPVPAVTLLDGLMVTE